MALFGSTPPTGGGGFGSTPPTGQARAGQGKEDVCPSINFLATFADPPLHTHIPGEPGDPPLERLMDHEWPEWQQNSGCGLISVVMLNMQEHWEDLRKKYGKGKKDDPARPRPTEGERSQEWERFVKSEDVANPGENVLPDVMSPALMERLADCVEKKSKEFHKRTGGKWGKPWTRESGGMRTVASRNWPWQDWKLKKIDWPLVIECEYEIFNDKHGGGAGGPGEGGKGDGRQVVKDPPVPGHPPGSPVTPPDDPDFGNEIGMTCPPWCKLQKAAICYNAYWIEATRRLDPRLGWHFEEFEEHHCSYCETIGCEIKDGNEEVCYLCYSGPGQSGGSRYKMCVDYNGDITQIRDFRKNDPNKPCPPDQIFCTVLDGPELPIPGRKQYGHSRVTAFVTEGDIRIHKC